MSFYGIKPKIEHLSFEQVFKTYGIDQKTDQHISTTAGGIAKSLATEYPLKRRIKEVDDR